MTRAAITVVALVAAVGCSTPPRQVVPDVPPSPASTFPAVPPQGQPGATDPRRVVIASIGLDERMIDLGLAADGSMEVPTDYGDVGWFTGGGRPGGFGPTVVAGHVDSTTGPAVFSRLSEVSEGDVVQLEGADGRAFDYRIYRVTYVAKDAFPTAEVFSAVRADEVRVITCAGEFDRDAGKYDQNVVVFGSRIQSVLDSALRSGTLYYGVQLHTALPNQFYPRPLVIGSHVLEPVESPDRADDPRRRTRFADRLQVCHQRPVRSALGRFFVSRPFDSWPTLLLRRGGEVWQSPKRFPQWRKLPSSSKARPQPSSRNTVACRYPV